MTDPERLHTTPESELERALLSAGRSYGASAATRANVLSAVGLAGVTASSSAAASSALTKGTLSKVAVALIVAGSAALPTWRYLSNSNNEPAPHAAPVAKVASLPQSPAATVEAPPVEAAPVLPLENVPLAPPTPAPLAARVEPKPAAGALLAAELAALDAARTSLSHSDPAAALAALDTYSRNFPRGKLGIEAEVLRIGALAKSGQTEAARKRAEAFLRRHPDSVLASRVRSYAGL